MVEIICKENEIEDFLIERLAPDFRLRFVARQVRTPAGVVDVLAYCPINEVWYIIEIKKGCILPDALAQVLRYKRYFDEVNNKQGRRFFHPILVGNTLSSELSKVVEYFENDNTPHIYSHAVCSYRCFDFSAQNGIRFTFINCDEKDYSEELENISEKEIECGLTNLARLIENQM